MGDESNDRPLVLVADDDEDILELVAFRLRRSGYEVITAGDGEQALNAVRESSPALVVLDLMMPKLTGFAVIEAMRADMATRHVPIILLTASTQDSDVERGLEAGADECIRKPFVPRELSARVDALLGSRSRSG